MHPVLAFEFILVLVAAILCLEIAARRLRAPNAAALIVGGAGLAFIPGMPRLTLDPALVLTLFLPPLLMVSAYFTVWRDFRRNLASILLLAIGAVLFTTFVVGIAVRSVMPGLPWAACFALGAVVSPPDAVAAKAVLERVRLPRRITALLEGESLLNDASGIVVFRFAVAAALTGGFSAVHATADFAMLAVVGAVFGAAIAGGAILALRRLGDVDLAILVTLLTPYAAYIGADRLGGSGVIATVITGLIIGWYQHDVLSAETRRTASSVWRILTHLLEALVFVLIGLSLRGVVDHVGGPGETLARFAAPCAATIAAVVLSRFAWVVGSDRLHALYARVVRRRPAGPVGPALAMSWAGMRGVVTLAIALSLPERMPGRDVILVAAFAVILVTVLVQGSTLGLVIRLLGIDDAADLTGGERRMTEIQARAAVAAAQHALIRARAYEGEALRHPRLLERYQFRAAQLDEISRMPNPPVAERDAHYDLVLRAIAAGRAEILRLQRAGCVDDALLHTMEFELDLEEMAARRVLERPRS